jgi:putative spermidine/putrescine transport system permease protein
MNKPPRLLTLAAFGALLFLHVPLLTVMLYAFTTEENAFTFPPPALTTRWFEVAFNRADLWAALWLSVQVALIATAIALVLRPPSTAANSLAARRFRCFSCCRLRCPAS